MRYISTRGLTPPHSFEEVVTAGLAPDGGLFVPEEYPVISKDVIKSWAKLSYQELAVEVMHPLTDGSLTKSQLRELVDKSYSTFRDKDIAPLHQLEDGHYVLELFHGPTLAFKDFALQFLGHLLDYFLEKKGQKVVIVGATSGDTGSAAIEGCRASKHIQLFMLHPYRRVSDVQRKQMTTVIAPHIHNLAIGAPEYGNFDDCQDMVKAMFRNPEFLEGHKLTAVNSINWARIMAQVVYYFYAALKLGAPEKPVSFSVPTGNFGDIFAGYIAKKMGLPINKLVVATNQNDILDRFFKANDYSKKGVYATVAPSMDIQISSNFERLLFDLYEKDAVAINGLMDSFQKSGGMQVTNKVISSARGLFGSHATDDAGIKKAMQEIYKEYDYLIDPHTATGVKAARAYMEKGMPMVTLATAHPAKFPAVAEEAVGFTPELPEHLKDLFERKEAFVELPNTLDEVKAYIKANA